MPKTKDNLQVTGSTVDELVRNLNFLLQRVADRMDRIEGIRGTASIESDLEMNNNRVRELGSGTATTDSARVGDLLTEPLTLSKLTVTGDSTLSDVFVLGNDGAVIHSLE